MQDSLLSVSKYINLDIFPQSFSKVEAKMYLIVNMRFYAQFHIQTVKSFLHIRMNKKAKELETKLNNGKIISNEILKNIEVSGFFSKQDKKQDDLKLFSEEFTKVQV